MTSPGTEWPSTPVPEPFKHLLNLFYSLGDQKSESAGRQLGEDVFIPSGQIIVNKRKINGAAGMTGKGNDLPISKCPADLIPEQTRDIKVKSWVCERHEDSTARDLQSLHL